MTRFKYLVAQAAESVADFIAEHAAQIADETGESKGAAHEALAKASAALMKSARPAEADGRTALWRVRIQLAPNTANAGVAYDSDPSTPAGAPGALLCRGLGAVAYALACRAAEFHAGRDIEGLGEETLKHSLRGLRVSLSRLGGAAYWRPCYSLAPRAAGEDAPSGSLRGVREAARGPESWRAFVHVVRENENKGAP
jgi:hypothetical protein